MKALKIIQAELMELYKTFSIQRAIKKRRPTINLWMLLMTFWMENLKTLTGTSINHRIIKSKVTNINLMKKKTFLIIIKLMILKVMELSINTTIKEMADKTVLRSFSKSASEQDHF